MTSLDPAALHQAKQLIADWRRVALFSHEKPDGDAIGSLVAMRATLRQLGLSADAILLDPLPDRYDFFLEGGPLPVLGKDIRLEDLAAYDAAIILDTCSYSQLRPIADWLRTTPIPKLVVDHHSTRDDIGDLQLVDEPAAATCLVLYDWFRTVGWPIREEAARALFVGIATDTGWFRHSNTDDRAFGVCADLVAHGVQSNAAFQALYQRESSARLRLLGAALGSLELRSDGRLAIMTIDPNAFAACSASQSDTEDLVNEPLRIASVVVSLLFVETGDGVVRINFRSKAGASPNVDVADLAKSLGGGGHRRAAGARISGSLQEVRAKISTAAERLL